MKPWNAWVACLGCAGLCLALVGCGGGSNVADPESDANAAKAPNPGGAAGPPAVVQNEPEPAPVEPAPAPTAVPEAPPPPPPTVTAAAPTATQPMPEPLAINKPETPASPEKPAEPAAMPAAPGAPAAMPAAAPASPNPPGTTPTAAAAGTAPATVADPNAANNPFAVFSETPAASPAATMPPAQPGAPAESFGESATAPAPPAEGNAADGALGYLNASDSGDRGGESGNFHTPLGGAMAFLNALKSKNLEKVAEATALRAPMEAVGTTNQRIFQAILNKEISEEDLAEFAKKLDGYQISGANQAKSTAKIGITISKMEGNSFLRRTITMRHERAGWKVSDISGTGEIKRAIGNMRPRGR